MRPISYFLFILIFGTTLFGQIRTEEKKKTINEKGDTVFTESIMISMVEDITPREDMIVINPLKFFIFYNISYFHKITDHVALGGGFQIPTIKGIHGFGINCLLYTSPSPRDRQKSRMTASG
jgi:hypothetical protein